MDDVTFDGQVAVVTGAGRGLGRAHALGLASRGARVVVNDVGGGVDGMGSSATPASEVVAEIEQLGGEAVADTTSVGSPEGGEAIVQRALDAFGRVDIIVNNAGILRDKSFGNMTPDMVRDVFNVHLEGTFWVTKAAWPHLRDQSYGRVIATSSMGGYLGNYGQTNYGTAKMGLIGFVKALAVEGARYGIKANAIAPAAYTRMNDELGLPEEAKRLTPELVSPAVLFLAHKDCPVSGDVLAVGGGRVARVVFGETEGFFDPDLTVEQVRDRWDDIADVGTFKELRTVEDGFEMFFKHFT